MKTTASLTVTLACWSAATDAFLLPASSGRTALFHVPTQRADDGPVCRVESGKSSFESAASDGDDDTAKPFYASPTFSIEQTSPKKTASLDAAAGAAASDPRSDTDGGSDNNASKPYFARKDASGNDPDDKEPTKTTPSAVPSFAASPVVSEVDSVAESVGTERVATPAADVDESSSNRTSGLTTESEQSTSVKTVKKPSESVKKGITIVGDILALGIDKVPAILTSIVQTLQKLGAWAKTVPDQVDFAVKEAKQLPDKVQAKARQTQEYIDRRVKDTQDTINRTIKTTQGTINRTVETTQETIDRTVKTTQLVIIEVKDIPNKVERKVDDAKRTVKETKAQVKQTVQDTKNTIDRSINTTQRFINDVKDIPNKVTRTVDNVKVTVKETKAQVERTVQGTKDAVDNSIKTTKMVIEEVKDIPNKVNRTVENAKTTAKETKEAVDSTVKGTTELVNATVVIVKGLVGSNVKPTATNITTNTTDAVSTPPPPNSMPPVSDDSQVKIPKKAPTFSIGSSAAKPNTSKKIVTATTSATTKDTQKRQSFGIIPVASTTTRKLPAQRNTTDGGKKKSYDPGFPKFGTSIPQAPSKSTTDVKKAPAKDKPVTRRPTFTIPQLDIRNSNGSASKTQTEVLKKTPTRDKPVVRRPTFSLPKIGGNYKAKSLASEERSSTEKPVVKRPSFSLRQLGNGRAATTDETPNKNGKYGSNTKDKKNRRKPAPVDFGMGFPNRSGKSIVDKDLENEVAEALRLAKDAVEEAKKVKRRL